MKQIKIGIIGCDTSHCVRFTSVLQEGRASLVGASILGAYTACGGEREKRFSAELAALGVPFMASPEALAERADALMILSGDGASHGETFRRVARFSKPVFIDKPLAVTTQDAAAILREAAVEGSPVFSASALRFSLPFCKALEGVGKLAGIEVAAPAPWHAPEQGLFYYGIHAVEMLMRAMGPGCSRVFAFSNSLFDCCSAQWSDGRYAVLRGNRVGNKQFSVALHTEEKSVWVEDALAGETPLYLPLLEEIVGFFRSGRSPVEDEAMLTTIRFIEAAHRSALEGGPVSLSDDCWRTQ